MCDHVPYAFEEQKHMREHYRLETVASRWKLQNIKFEQEKA